MTPRELMKMLAENEDTLINAISLSKRNIQYGRGEFAFFNSELEVVGTLNFLVDEMESSVSRAWNPMGAIIRRYKEFEEVEQEDLTEFRNAVFDEVKAGLKLLANIDKAKESMEFKEMWKEQKDGNCEEGYDLDEEI